MKRLLAGMLITTLLSTGCTIQIGSAVEQQSPLDLSTVAAGVSGNCESTGLEMPLGIYNDEMVTGLTCGGINGEAVVIFHTDNPDTINEASAEITDTHLKGYNWLLSGDMETLEHARSSLGGEIVTK